MEEVFKKTAKRAPVVTAVLVFILLVAAKVFEQEISRWVLGGFVFGCFVLVYLIIFFNYRKNNDKSINISKQKISDVDTDGGDFLVGTKGKSSEKIAVEENEIKGVKTGGGDFTIGKRE